jgi:hypothetical protein
MGYSITIGNAVPFFSKDYDELYACWEVESATSDEAPTFINDQLTGNSNGRHPSYSAWSDFCRTTGLYDLFYKEWEGLIHKHPGCVMITEDDYAEVHNALEKYKKTATKPPGFDDWRDSADKIAYDPYLARLMWLDFWMRWALDNCETPAIHNR